MENQPSLAILRRNISLPTPLPSLTSGQWNQLADDFGAYSKVLDNFASYVGPISLFLGPYGLSTGSAAASAKLTALVADYAAQFAAAQARLAAQLEAIKRQKRAAEETAARERKAREQARQRELDRHKREVERNGFDREFNQGLAREMAWETSCRRC